MPVVCFEGINGAGKQTQIDLFCEELKKRDISHVVFHDPGITDNHPCQELRDLFIHGDRWQDSRVPLLIGTAARCELNAEIHKAIRAGTKMIILDRYQMSTFVYQTLMLEASYFITETAVGFVKQLGELIGCIQADTLIYLDVLPEKAYPRRVSGRRRVEKDGDVDDQFEKRGLEFSNRLYSRYQRIFQRPVSESSPFKGVLDSLCKDCVVVYERAGGLQDPEELFDFWFTPLSQRFGLCTQDAHTVTA